MRTQIARTRSMRSGREGSGFWLCGVAPKKPDRTRFRFDRLRTHRVIDINVRMKGVVVFEP
jgi:hypothetical protein